MANFDLHNLVLNDNQFDVVPAGSYHFRVMDLEEGFYSGNSTKIPSRRRTPRRCCASVRTKGRNWRPCRKRGRGFRRRVRNL